MAFETFLFYVLLYFTFFYLFIRTMISLKVELNIVNTEFAMFQFEYVSMVLSVEKAFL